MSIGNTGKKWKITVQKQNYELQLMHALSRKNNRFDSHGIPDEQSHM
jgi:hypothetical protein